MFCRVLNMNMILVKGKTKVPLLLSAEGNTCIMVICLKNTDNMFVTLNSKYDWDKYFWFPSFYFHFEFFK